jgi:hypothetical protein
MVMIIPRALDPGDPARPTWWRAVLFRFAFVYWILFSIPVIATQIFGLEWIGNLIVPAINAILQSLGGLVFGITQELSIADNGSGDRLGDWVLLFGIAGVALITAVVWSLIDRRRAHDAQLRALLHVHIRYTLAFAMLVFGAIKLFVLQFPAPGTTRLLQRYGDSSPMGLLWTFMGSSPAYVFFSGLAETVGAVLLLFRRTTTLGALVLIAALSNVALLNFCYDVCVKIHSVHYLAMAVFLLLPDLGRLVGVLLLDRAIPPRARPPVAARRSTRVTLRVIKYIAIVVLVALNLKATLEERAGSRPFLEPTTWYDGTWDVVAFARDGVDVPPLLTDATRWRRVVFYAGPEGASLRWRHMDESRGETYALVIDERTQTMTATLKSDKNPRDSEPVALRYMRTDADHLTLEGTIGGAALTVKLERFDPRTMLLVNRGFHWISETPFNR